MAERYNPVSQQTSFLSRLIDVPENELVTAAQGGCCEAIEQLFVRHRGLMLRIASRLTANPEEAEDVVQDAMFRIYRNIGGFRKESRFTTWVARIVNNSAISLKRKAKGVRWISLEDACEGKEGTRMWEPSDPRRSPEQLLLDQELSTAITAIVRTLPSRQRTVMRACVFNEKSMSDAAMELGITVATVKSRLNRARHRMNEVFVRLPKGCRTDFRKPARRPDASS